MDYQDILYVKKEGVARITIQSPTGLQRLHDEHAAGNVPRAGTE